MVWVTQGKSLPVVEWCVGLNFRVERWNFLRFCRISSFVCLILRISIQVNQEFNFLMNWLVGMGQDDTVSPDILGYRWWRVSGRWMWGQLGNSEVEIYWWWWCSSMEIMGELPCFRRVNGNLLSHWENTENHCYSWFLYNIYDHEKYYPGKPVNLHIQSLINIIQENN